MLAQRVALIIGNANYAGHPPLANPVNDARDLSAVLRELGFRVSLHQDLRRLELHRAVDEFMRTAEGADFALVFFAGHGMQAGGENFLLPVDFAADSERQLRADGLRMSELMSDLEGRRIRHTLILVDACRDNPFQASTRSAARGLARPPEASGALLVGYATADGATADDGSGRNGLFTGALIDLLRQSPANQSIRDLLDDTQLAVERASNGRQRPRVYGDTARFRSVSLRLPTAASASNTGVMGGVLTNSQSTTVAQAQQRAWEEALRANSLAGFLGFIERFPDAPQALDVAARGIAFAQPVNHPPGSCKIHTPASEAGDFRYHWSGACVAGRAHGNGSVTVDRPSAGTLVHSGQLAHGIREGVWRMVISQPASAASPPPLWVDRRYVAGVLVADWESYEMPDGFQYTGAVRRTASSVVRHGQGIARLPNGAVQEGSWVEDHPQGFGVRRGPGSYLYEGEFVQGRATGQARIRYTDGGSYSGAVLNWRRHGLGELNAPDGTVVRGRWESDSYLGP